MNIFSISTASSYVKFKELAMKWQERKDNPFLEKGNQKKDENPEVAFFKSQIQDIQKQSNMASISGKLQAGMGLSPAELEYIKKNAPDLYEKAVQIAKEREAYKEELRRCKSKEEVDDLNMRKLSQFCGEARAITGNPNIPEEKKRERLEFISMRMMAVMDEHYSFKETTAYQKLPDRKEDGEKSDKQTSAVSPAKKDVQPEEETTPVESQDQAEILKELSELLTPSAGSDTPETSAEQPAATPAKTDASPAVAYNSQGQVSNISSSASTSEISVKV